MRLIVVSDLHLDARTGGYARHNDVERALFEAVAVANRTADYFLCLGDVMDPDSGSCVFNCVRTLVEVCSRLTIPSWWLAGNHDVIEDGSGKTTLEPLEALHREPFVRVIDQPGVFGDGPLSILAFPFTAYSHKYDPRKWVESVVTTKPNLVIGHLNVKGAQPGDETTMVRGRDVWLPVKELRAKFGDVPILNGHIHKRQQTEDGVWIPGSMERLRFDEERHQPGWLEVEL